MDNVIAEYDYLLLDVGDQKRKELHHWIQQGRWGWGRPRGRLAYLYDKKYVHGNLKPSNVYWRKTWRQLFCYFRLERGLLPSVTGRASDNSGATDQRDRDNCRWTTVLGIGEWQKKTKSKQVSCPEII